MRPPLPLVHVSDDQRHSGRLKPPGDFSSEHGLIGWAGTVRLPEPCLHGHNLTFGCPTSQATITHPGGGQPGCGCTRLSIASIVAATSSTSQRRANSWVMI